MSGRWVERTQNMALSSLIVLDKALSGLRGFSWVSRPIELSELESVDSSLDESEKTLGSLLKQAEEMGLDASSMESALEGDDKALSDSLTTASRSSEEIGMFAERIQSEIRNLDSLVSRRAKLIDSLERNLPKTVTLETPDGRKELVRKLGTYRATERRWEEYGENVRVNWAWLDNLVAGYSKSKSEITDSSRDVDKSEYSKALSKLSEKRRAADLASIKASEEKMRRERKAELNKIFKERGYKVRKKSSGKKNVWEFTSYTK